VIYFSIRRIRRLSNITLASKIINAGNRLPECLGFGAPENDGHTVDTLR
jgi:hypothetical protein